MGRNNDNIIKAKIKAEKITKQQLIKWNVLYNELIFESQALIFILMIKIYHLIRIGLEN